MNRTITVRGRGTASAAPDAIRVSGEFSAVFPAYDEAVKASAMALRDLRKALGDAGFDMDDLRTTRLSVHPEHRSDGKRIVLEGYRFNHGITLTEDSDPETVSRLLSAIYGSEGAPRFSLEYILRDDSRLRAKARAAAVADARARAKELASAAKVRLGDVIEIRYEPDSSYGGMRLMGCNAACGIDAVPEDIVAEEDVQVSWSISRGKRKEA